MLVEKTSHLLSYLIKNEKQESVKNLEIAKILAEDILKLINNEIAKIERHSSEKNRTRFATQSVILVDIDDVLADFRSEFARYCENNGVKVNIDSTSYYFMEDAQESLNLFEKFVYGEHGLKRLKRTSSSFPLCEKLLQLENAGYTVVFLTSRSDDPLVKLHTETWLRHDLSDIFFVDTDNIIYAKEKYSAAISIFGYDAIAFAIDDSPKHLLEYESHGIPAISPLKSYNANLNISGYYDDHDNFENISNLIDLTIVKRKNRE